MTHASSRSPETPITERLALAALAMERYVLPWIYFAVSWLQIQGVYARIVTVWRIHSRPGFHDIPWSVFWAGLTRDILMSCLSIFIGLTLFISRRAVHLPKKLDHITVPLAMSYYFFLYRGVDKLPLEWRENLMPAEWRVPAAVGAVVLALIGYAVAIWGLCYLGRSFAILVAARKLVSGGPYAYVRHPMYLGYIFELAGLLLASFSPGMLILGAGFLLLMDKRARLEEEWLSDADPAYREYMQRTGRFFPRFGRAVEAVGPEARGGG